MKTKKIPGMCWGWLFILFGAMGQVQGWQILNINPYIRVCI